MMYRSVGCIGGRAGPHSSLEGPCVGFGVLVTVRKMSVKLKRTGKKISGAKKDQIRSPEVLGIFHSRSPLAAPYAFLRKHHSRCMLGATNFTT